MNEPEGRKVAEPQSRGLGDIPDRAVRVLVVLCALVLIPDLFYRGSPAFGWQGWIGFYAVFGALAAFVFVAVARAWRKLVERPEDYHDR
jgi:hypothetical protein